MMFGLCKLLLQIVATDDNTEVDTYSFVLTKDEVMSMMRFTQYENKTQQLLRLKNVSKL